MDWSNEIYVKVYTRETDDDLLLSWNALSVWRAMLLKFDRSGLLATKRGRRGLAALIRASLEIVESAVPELLADGRIREIDSGYYAPNFVEAQEASKSDKLRQRESRERRRPGHSVTKRDDQVTKRDAEPDPVTKRDQMSRDPGGLSLSALHSSASDLSPDLRSPSPELPDLGAAVRAERVQAPATPTRARSRDDLRRQLFGRIWNFCAVEYQKAKTEGIDPHALNCWSGMPAASSPEAQALFEIIDQVAPGDAETEFDRAEAVIRNRVLVAFTEARHKQRHLQFCIPARMWRPDSFSIAKDLSPAQVAQRTGAKPSPDLHSEAPRRKTLT